jgi:hypothetical protein
MSCNITAGFSLDCRDSQGGIEYIYIGNTASTGFTATDGLITAITGLTASNFFKFEVPKQTSSFTETITLSEENGTVFYDQQVSVVFTKLSAEKRNQIALLAKNRKLVVVLKDGNGTFWSVGIGRGAHLLSGTNQTGQAYGDLNGYSLVIQGLEKDPSYAVSASVVGE